MRLGYNVGVRLRPDQLVIDADPRNYQGADRLAELCARFRINMQDFPYVLTGGGGFHIYTTKPTDLRTKEKVADFPGIEFKTAGRQVVAAGSVHPDRKLHYRAQDIFGDLISPPPVPETLLTAIMKDSRTTKSSNSGPISPEQLATLLSALDPIAYADREQWLKLMMASHHATRGEGIEPFVIWSARDPRFANDEQSVRSTWDSLSADRPEGITAATLYKAVVDAGRSDLVASIPQGTTDEDFEDAGGLAALEVGRSGQPLATFGNCLRVLRRLELALAYDELSRKPMIQKDELPWRADIGRELNDDTLRMIRNHIIESTGIEFSKENVTEASLTLARQNTFNPVVDYLASLTWDGVPRLDRWLSTYLGARDTELTRAAGRIALIAAVRRARRPGCKFDQVLILEGPQGTGKSSALKILGGNWHSDAELGSLESKEAPLVLQGVWIYELGELTAMGRSEVEDLKAFVSRSEDRFRTPFDRMAHTDPRRCVFFGTTNAETYLFDMTGNRRFWPIKTGAIDLEVLKRDRDQLWAEAATAEVTGESIELRRELWLMAAQEQESRLATDPWRDQLVAWLEADNHPFDSKMGRLAPKGRVERVHTRDLLDLALCIPQGKQTQQMAKRLRELMRTIPGWEYTRGLRIDGSGPAAGYERVESKPS
jgi:hypothetical protein